MKVPKKLESNIVALCHIPGKTKKINENIRKNVKNAIKTGKNFIYEVEDVRSQLYTKP